MVRVSDDLIIAAIEVVAGVLVGLALRLVLGRLRHHARNTRHGWDDVAIDLLRNIALPLTVSAGVWFALQQVHLSTKVRHIVDHILVAAVILAVTLVLAGLAGGVVRSIALARSGVAASASIFVNLARVLVLVIGLLVLLQGFGVSITPLLTALGVGGLAVALALQDTLANFFAGVHILASKKVQQGDYVCLDTGEEGYIVDINWRNTSVRQLGGNLVVVPNAKFADAILTNYYRPAEDMSVLVQARVGYDSDLELVERITIEVGREVMAEVPGAVTDHEPFIRYHTLADSSINFSVILRGREYTDQYLITHEFIKRLHARYRAEGVEIPFPTRTLATPRGARPLSEGFDLKQRTTRE